MRLRSFGSRGAALAASSLVLACVGVLGTPGVAHACKCAQGGVTKHAEQAEAVFTASVLTSSEETLGSGKKARQVRRYTAEVDRIYQGSVTEPTVLITTAQLSAACGLGKIPEGKPWVFFVNGADTKFFGNSCGGSARASGEYVGFVERILGPGDVLVEPAPPPPPLAFTDEPTDPPTALPRLLAPGAAVAIIGLLGLVLVRRKSAPIPD